MIRLPSRRARALAAAGLVALAAAGCGGSGADYGKQVTQVQSKYRDSITKDVSTGAAMLATDPAAAQTKLAHAAAEAHKMAEEVAALDAPSGKKSAALKLVAVYRSLATSLDALAGATKAKDPTALQGILAKLQKAQSDEQAAVTALNG